MALTDVVERGRLVAMLFASVERLGEAFKLWQGLLRAFLSIERHRSFQAWIQPVGRGRCLGSKQRTDCQNEREARTASRHVRDCPIWRKERDRS